MSERSHKHGWVTTSTTTLATMDSCLNRQSHICHILPNTLLRDVNAIINRGGCSHGPATGAINGNVLIDRLRAPIAWPLHAPNCSISPIPRIGHVLFLQLRAGQTLISCVESLLPELMQWSGFDTWGIIGTAQSNPRIHFEKAVVTPIPSISHNPTFLGIGNTTASH